MRPALESDARPGIGASLARLAGRRLRLSCFDGAHAFLFDAELLDDGTLAGEFWSRDSWHETWTARRDDHAELPDAFGLTQWVAERGLEEAVYPDLEGRPRSLADPEFAGRARIIELFGTWCPNCNDAAPFLVEMHRRYAVHHGIEFPLLVAGLSDKTEASRAFPLVDRVRSYPTTIFLHGDGRVRAVHQGYAGPATGEANEALRTRFVELVEELLDER